MAKVRHYGSLLVDPMEKMKKMKNPKMKEKFLEGFNDGYDLGYAEARDTATAQFAVRLERLQTLFVEGSKRLDQIMMVFQAPLTEEERQQSEDYIKQLREGKSYADKK